MIKKKQSIKHNHYSFAVDVELIILKEGKYYVAYCPALELSSYAKSESKVLSAFEENLEIFFEETTRKETLEKVLLGFGWTLQQKPNANYQPPRYNIDSMSRLFKSNYRRITKETLSLPIPA